MSWAKHPSSSADSWTWSRRGEVVQVAAAIATGMSAAATRTEAEEGDGWKPDGDAWSKIAARSFAIAKSICQLADEAFPKGGEA